MAKHRMLNVQLIESSKFYALSNGAQALYVHFNMHADDDGIVDAHLLLRGIKGAKKYLDELIDSGYIVRFGVDNLLFIPDWCRHNRLRRDRKTDSEHLDELLATVPEAIVRPKGKGGEPINEDIWPQYDEPTYR